MLPSWVAMVFAANPSNVKWLWSVRGLRCRAVGVMLRILPSLKLTAKAAENGWLEYKPFLLGKPTIFRGYASFREGTMVNHHLSPPCGEYVWNFFPTTSLSKSKGMNGLDWINAANVALESCFFDGLVVC